jgi:hypothetical protein
MYFQEKNTLKNTSFVIWSSFGIVVAVTFQSIFCLKIYQNKFFFIFDINISKQSKNIKKILI